MENRKSGTPYRKKRSLDFELQCLFGHKHYTCGLKVIQAFIIGDESIFIVYGCALHHGYGK